MAKGEVSRVALRSNSKNCAAKQPSESDRCGGNLTAQSTVTGGTVSGREVQCDYPVEVLYKVFASSLRTYSPEAYDLLRALTITRDDQLAYLGATGDGASAEGAKEREAACAWVTKNKDLWGAWLPTNPPDCSHLRGELGESCGASEGGQCVFDQYTHDGAPYPEGRCQCEPNYVGVACEQCADGFFEYVATSMQRISSYGGVANLDALSAPVLCRPCAQSTVAWEGPSRQCDFISRSGVEFRLTLSLCVVILTLLVAMVLMPPNCRRSDLEGEPLALHVLMLIGGALLCASPLHAASEDVPNDDRICILPPVALSLGFVILFTALLLRARVKARALGRPLSASPAPAPSSAGESPRGQVVCATSPSLVASPANGDSSLDTVDVALAVVMVMAYVAIVSGWLATEPPRLDKHHRRQALFGVASGSQQFGPACAHHLGAVPVVGIVLLALLMIGGVLCAARIGAARTHAHMVLARGLAASFVLGLALGATVLWVVVSPNAVSSNRVRFLVYSITMQLLCACVFWIDRRTIQLTRLMRHRARCTEAALRAKSDENQDIDDAFQEVLELCVGPSTAPSFSSFTGARRSGLNCVRSTVSSSRRLLHASSRTLVNASTRGLLHVCCGARDGSETSPSLRCGTISGTSASSLSTRSSGDEASPACTVVLPPPSESSDVVLVTEAAPAIARESSQTVPREPRCAGSTERASEHCNGSEVAPTPAPPGDGSVQAPTSTPRVARVTWTTLQEAGSGAASTRLAPAANGTPSGTSQCSGGSSVSGANTPLRSPSRGRAAFLFRRGMWKEASASEASLRFRPFEGDMPVPSPLTVAALPSASSSSAPPHACTAGAMSTLRESRTDEAEPERPPRAGDRFRELLADEPILPAAEYYKRLCSVAARLRDPKYTLRNFHRELCELFPELRLYLGHGGMSSGMQGSDEYLRTLGALYAVYWLCRLDLPTVAGSAGLDGQRGFCFGVDQQWRPPSEYTIAAARRQVEAEQEPTQRRNASGAVGLATATASGANDEEIDPKRLAFLCQFDWAKTHALMVDAGILAESDGSVAVDEERAAAMLALTAIHDVCKVQSLQPTVLPEHAPYHGYATGDVITDHDCALAYVLDHDPHALPCFAALPPAQQHACLFTQAQLGFNHGWLVQGEAPPGALFTRMRHVVRDSSTSASDIAFYFVHWLTDLAGAIPTPLHGAEKFATKFPVPVLKSFIHAFALVKRLAHTPPTQLNLEFLETFWPRHLGDLPTGPTAIALMRLAIQVQDMQDQLDVCTAFAGLPPDDQALLGEEMARSGVEGELYTRSPVVGGPAFLVYYSPAFLRNLAPTAPHNALRILAAVYRHARAMWPASAERQGECVTVYVDALKACGSLDAVRSAHSHGGFWALVKKSEQEAVVERRALRDLPAMLRESCPANGAVEVLPFWEAELADEPLMTEPSRKSVAAAEGNKSGPVLRA